MTFMEAKRERRSETFIDKHMHKPKGLRNSNFWRNSFRGYSVTKVNLIAESSFTTNVTFFGYFHTLCPTIWNRLA